MFYWLNLHLIVFLIFRDLPFLCVYLLFCAAEDWLNPSFILEAFEARAVRLAVNCAQNVAKASSPEEGPSLSDH